MIHLISRQISVFFKGKVKLKDSIVREPRNRIKKSSGDYEPFSERKLQRSILRTGISPKSSRVISKEVARKIHPGSSTKEIYRHTVKLIKKKSSLAAIHYSLKKSLLDLGPAGYEFEKLIAKYFEALGFTTSTDVVLQGKFVSHEVDVIATKNQESYFTECKFHNSGRKNDIKTALYVKSRWDDLKSGPDGRYLSGYFLASNTAFTKDAITYSKGVGLNLLGINAPEDEGLLDKIKIYKLYPITSLIRLKKQYKSILLNKQIILCSELLHQESFLLKLGMSKEEVIQLFSDINYLLDNQKE